MKYLIGAFCACAAIWLITSVLIWNDDGDRAPAKLSTKVLVWIDPDTGCHWLTRDGYITPRLSGDGKQICVL